MLHKEILTFSALRDAKTLCKQSLPITRQRRLDRKAWQEQFPGQDRLARQPAAPHPHPVATRRHYRCWSGASSASSTSTWL